MTRSSCSQQILEIIFGKDLQNSLERNCYKVVLKLTLQQKSSKKKDSIAIFFRNNCFLDHLHKATSLPCSNARLTFSFISLDVLAPSENWARILSAHTSFQFHKSVPNFCLSKIETLHTTKNETQAISKRNTT